MLVLWLIFFLYPISMCLSWDIPQYHGPLHIDYGWVRTCCSPRSERKCLSSTALHTWTYVTLNWVHVVILSGDPQFHPTITFDLSRLSMDKTDTATINDIQIWIKITSPPNYEKACVTGRKKIFFFSNTSPKSIEKDIWVFF